MKTIAFIAEENARKPGQPIHACWQEIPGARFESMIDAIEFSRDFNLRNHSNRIAIRVIERVVHANGAMTDHQVYPHFDDVPVRELAALRTAVPMEALWSARAADAAQDPVSDPVSEPVAA